VSLKKATNICIFIFNQNQNFIKKKPVISRSSFWKYISRRCAREWSSWNSLRWGMHYEALSVKHESNHLCQRKERSRPRTFW